MKVLVVYSNVPPLKDGAAELVFWDCETTGLLRNVEGSRIVSATFLEDTGRRVSFVGDDEAGVLRRIFDVFRKYGSDCVFVGYNTLRFDIPFIEARADILGFSQEEILRPSRNLDLFSIVRSEIKRGKWPTLAEACRYFGADARIRYSGRDVLRFVEERQWDKVLEHNLEDVVAIRKLYYSLEKWGCLNE